MKSLLILLLPLTACAQINPPTNKFNVTIKIDELKAGDSIYFSYHKYVNGEPVEVVDTAIFESDKVNFRGEISEPIEANILRFRTEKVDTAAQLKLIKDIPLPDDQRAELEEYFLNPRKMDQYTFLLMAGETTIKAKQSLMRASAEGPEGLNVYLKLKKDFERANREAMFSMEDLRDPFAMPDSAEQEKMMKVFDSIRTITQKNIYLKYAVENPQSPVAIYALSQAIPRTMDSTDVYIDVLNNLSPEIRELQSAKRLLKKLEALKKTEIGRIVEDFQQPDADGKQVKLSSFRGKYVLIELWASWCYPCRKKNPGLVMIQDKYSNKNFTILGVALEQKDDRNKWLAAIKKDGLTWPQLSDFKFWENAVARQFGVNSIPFNMLIDPKGKIIAKNIYDSELDTMLGSLLK